MNNVESKAAHPIRVTIEPRFRDLDAMGHVNNAVYFTYLETARIKVRERLSTHATDPMDFNAIVAENHLVYRRPIEMGEPVALDCWFSHIRDKSYRFNYHVINPDTGELKAEGYTVMVGYDYRTGRVAPLTPEFLDRIRPHSV